MRAGARLRMGYAHGLRAWATRMGYVHGLTRGLRGRLVARVQQTVHSPSEAWAWLSMDLAEHVATKACARLCIGLLSMNLAVHGPAVREPAVHGLAEHELGRAWAGCAWAC
eukprot:352031-Chlamydomonas_euryale.AAC.3